MAKNKLVKKVLYRDYHRNGISGQGSGQGFEAVIFEGAGEVKGQRFLSIILDEDVEKKLGFVPCFVLDLDLAAQGNIDFDANSWRGDHFATEIREAIKRKNKKCNENANKE